MKGIWFKAISSDKGFLEFYEELAWNLANQGTVYTPHPLIPPNARMAIPAPTEAVVHLKSPAAIAPVHQSVKAYLMRSEKGELRLELENETVTVSRDNIPDEKAFIDKLIPMQPTAVNKLISLNRESAAATYAPLIVQTSLNPFASDHVAFISDVHLGDDERYAEPEDSRRPRFNCCQEISPAA